MTSFIDDPLASNNHKLDLETLNILYLSMLQIRLAEQLIARKRELGLIGGPVHLSVGQEAIPVGVSQSLTKDDAIFSAHRSHAHLLALGTNVHGLFSELLGNSSGLSRGMGGSMHLIDLANGFLGSTPIVAGTVPLAVGAAWASIMKGNSNIAVSYLGDGAMEEGVVHESLNLARIYNIPVLFVVENNLFASHMHINQRQPNSSTARFAAANMIPFKVIDGNNVLEISETASQFISEMREGGGPRFIEAITFRWFGHVDWREDIDVGVSRSADDLNNWKLKDPIKRLRNFIISNSKLDESYFNNLEEKILNQLDAQWDLAEKDTSPNTNVIKQYVYSKGFYDK
jgi:pyruvate dehydrogenase E1 component alpha subunit